MKKKILNLTIVMAVSVTTLAACRQKVSKVEENTTANITTMANKQIENNKTTVNNNEGTVTKAINTKDTTKTNALENKTTSGDKKEETKTETKSDVKTETKAQNAETTKSDTKAEEKAKDTKSNNSVLKDNGEYMALNNDRKDWSHGYPADLSEFNGIYSVGKGNIALTFDLGTEVGFTEKILDILEAKNVKGTFFITGTYAEKNKGIVDRIAASGNKFGMHGYNHVNMIKLTESGIDPLLEDISKWEEATGMKTTLYRAPEGAYSQRGMQVFKDLGYTSVFWGFAHKDWEENNQPDPKEALENIKKGIQDGDVILLHAYKTNSEILSDLIDWLRENNYNLVTP